MSYAPNSVFSWIKKNPAVRTAEKIAKEIDGRKKLIVSKPDIFQKLKSLAEGGLGGGTFVA